MNVINGMAQQVARIVFVGARVRDVDIAEGCQGLAEIRPKYRRHNRDHPHRHAGFDH